MDKALSGIRVIDMTHNQAGPACAQMLGFLGADVIKLEEPKGGDIARRNMRDQDSDSLFFLLFNANKRSLTLNLKTGRGKELFKELIAKSDVLVENFSPGERSTGSASACSRHCIGATIRAAATGRGDPPHCLASIPRLRRARPAASPWRKSNVREDALVRPVEPSDLSRLADHRSGLRLWYPAHCRRNRRSARWASSGTRIASMPSQGMPHSFRRSCCRQGSLHCRLGNASGLSIVRCCS